MSDNSIKELTAILRGEHLQDAKQPLLVRDLIDLEQLKNMIQINMTDFEVPPADAELSIELILCSSRTYTIICSIKKIKEQLNESENSVDVVSGLNRSLVKATQALGSNIARIESITKTLLAIDGLLNRDGDGVHD